VIRATYAAPALCVAVPTARNVIPEMTDPRGKHWQQPADIRDADMDSTFVRLTQRQVADLPEYSSSYPSGMYDGKCWLREGEDEEERTVRWLCWYEPHSDPKKIGIGFREISIID
jgi:hypothetical protein